MRVGVSKKRHRTRRKQSELFLFNSFIAEIVCLMSLLHENLNLTGAALYLSIRSKVKQVKAAEGA